MRRPSRLTRRAGRLRVCLLVLPLKSETSGAHLGAPDAQDTTEGGNTAHDAMVLRLIQLESEAGKRQCAVVNDDGSAVLIEGYSTTYELSLAALRAKKSMNEFVAPTNKKGIKVDYDAALKAGRVLAPIDHPDPAHSVRIHCAPVVPCSLASPRPSPPL